MEQLLRKFLQAFGQTSDSSFTTLISYLQSEMKPQPLQETEIVQQICNQMPTTDGKALAKRHLNELLQIQPPLKKRQNVLYCLL